MLRSVLALSFALAILVCGSGHASAGAWTLERGKTQTITTSSFSYGKFGFDDEGRLVEVPEYRKFTLNSSLEYGVRDWLTGIVRGELRQETSYGELYRIPHDSPIFVEGGGDTAIVYGNRAQTFGSVEAGARVRLINGPSYVVSAQAVAASGGFDSTGLWAQSDGPFAEARALFGIGKAVFGRHTFFDAQGAYRFRFQDDDSDEIKLDLTLGTQVLPRWMLLAQTFSTLEVGGNAHDTKAGGSIVYGLNDRLKVELGGTATVYGRNALQEFGGKVGVWWSY